MKKLLTYSVVVATIVWSLGLGAIVPVASAAYTPVAGDIIKTASNPAVYFIDSTGARRLFSTRATFGTWYANFNGLKTISQADFDALQSGSNVTARPGVNLIKFDNSSRVYAVAPGAVLHLIPSSAVATALYGSTWQSRVVTIQSSFESNYSKTGADLSATSGVASGSLIKYQGSEDIYYIANGAKRLVTSEAFIANNFRANAVITVPTTMTFDTGTSITAKEAAIASIDGTATPSTLGGLTVGLASTNPASATVIADSESAQSMVPFVAVNLTASSQGDVKVTGMKFERTGISNDTDLSDFYLYDGATRLADGGSLSSKVLTFNDTDTNGIITVPAGTTKTVVLKADVTKGASASKTIGFNLTAVTSNAASNNASYPVVGNLMTTASVSDLGYATLTALTTPTANTDVNAGEKNFEIGKVSLTANDQDLQLTGLRLTSIGTISKTDLSNIKLVISGTTLATASFNDNMELFFDLSGAPYEIAKGGTKTFSVQADVVNGATKTFKLSIEKSSDVVIKDKGYGVTTLVAGATLPSRPSYTFTVSTGTLSVTKDNSSASGSVSANATNVKVATFKFTANGEDVKVKTLNVQATTSNEALNGGLQNGKVYFDGVQVGSTKNLTENTSIEFTLGSSMIIAAGQTKLVDIYADIKTTTGTAINAGNFSVSLKQGSSNAQGMTSLSLVNAPTSDVAGNSLSVNAAGLTVAKYAAYGNQTMTSPATAAKIGSFTISAAANEGVTVSSIAVGNATSGELANMKLMVGTTQVGTTKDPLPSTNSTSTFSISNLALNAGETKVVDIYADIKSGLSSASIQLNASAEGTTPVTNTAVSSTAPALQTITVGSGSLATTVATKPDAAIAIAGTTIPVNTVKFAATNDAYTVTNLRITNAGTAANVASVIIEYPKKDGTTGTATQYLNGNNADFSNLAIYVAKNSTATVTVKAQLSTIASGATSGSTVQLNFAAPSGTQFAATGETSGTVTYTGPSAVTGNAMIVRASKPTVSIVALPTTVLAAGTQTIAKFTISADAAGSDVIWKQIAFGVSTSTGVGVTDSTVKLYKAGDSTALNSATSLVTAGAAKTITIVTTDEQSIAAGSSQTYELKADITGVTDNSSISTKVNSTGVSSAGTTTDYADLVVYETGFAWSDGSATPHTASSRDWADSTYVKDLPTSSQTLQK